SNYKHKQDVETLRTKISPNMNTNNVKTTLLTPKDRVKDVENNTLNRVNKTSTESKNNTMVMSNKVEHSGVLYVRSEDGKEIKLSDLDRIGKEAFGSYVKSTIYNNEGGFAMSNNKKLPISPI